MKSLKNWLNSVTLMTTLSVAATLMTGCGSSAGGVGNMLQNITLKSYNQNGDLWASMTAQIDTGAMILAGATIPIVNPHNPQQIYGELSMASNLCNPNGVCTGGGTLTIAVDLTQVSNAHIVDNTLPNGTMIPIGQAASQAIVALPLGKTNGRLYVAFGQGIAMLGVALPFSALNSVGQYIPGVNIFQPFANNGISGIVGLFTGASVNSTGVALFVDLSNMVHTASAGNLAIRAQSMERVQAPAAEALILNEVKPSYRDEQAVYYKLWKLNSKRTQLRLN